MSEILNICTELISSVYYGVLKHIPETIAILVASLSALFTFYQAILQRKHNRLSVRPHITTWLDEISDNEWLILRVDLMNNGIGPAIIHEFSIYFDNVFLGNNHDRKSLELSVKSKISEEKNILKNKISILGEEYSMLANSNLVLLEIHVPKYIGLNESAYQSFLERFTLKLSYESMYGEKWEYTS